MQKELNLDQAIAEISRGLKRHIGSNGTAHLPVSEDQSGFMTPELLVEHNTVFKKRTNIGDSAGTDILTLPVGNYAGSYWINHPSSAKATDINTTYAYVSVIPSSTDSRRFIVLVEAASGRIWTRTVNDTYEVNNKWSKMEQYATLWKGSSELTSPVTLSRPVRNDSGALNFSEVKVKFITGSNTIEIKPISLDVGNINSTNVVDGERIAKTTYEADLKFSTISGTTSVVATKNFGVNTYPNVIDEHDARIQVLDDAKITILEIRGYY